MKSLAFAVALLALTSVSAQAQSADTKGDLPCRFKAGLVSGTSERPKVFTTENANSHEGFKTSIGALTWAHDKLYQTIPLINGKPVSIGAENQGNFGNGKVYDLGGKILIAYQVERMEDSSASPSNLTLLVGPGGRVIEEHLVAGPQAWEYPCILVR